MNFESVDNELILNPRLAGDAKVFFEESFARYSSHFHSHIALATSGTTSSFGKLVFLSKEAFLVSAQSVNAHLQSNRKDIWLKALPDFHVGGLGMIARARLSGAELKTYISDKWHARDFYETLLSSGATLISLVPTQVFDLIKLNLRAPAHLRGVLVGGASLGDNIFTEAKKLGWPLLPSYGMTETCSMIACASFDDASIRALPHAKVRINSSDQIEISSRSLLSALVSNELVDPKITDPHGDKWFCSGDLASIQDGRIEIHGRGSDFVKVGGEGVSVLKIENIAARVALKNADFDYAILPVADARLGHRIDLICTAKKLSAAQVVADAINDKLAAFERIRQIHLVEQIPRSELGKLKRQEALALIQS